MEKRKLRIITTIIMALILISGTIETDVIRAYNEELDKDNHNYPVYTVLILTLNNKTKGELQAQTQIWDNRTKGWVENRALFGQIERDLKNLTEVIEGLDDATMFEYNSTFSPGCVYVVLSPHNLADAAIIANNTIDYILSHPSDWWYVDNVSIETIDLYWVSLDVLLYFFEYYIKEIDSLMFYNYSVVNNTLVIHYRTRYNLTNGFWYYNGTMWLPNWPFIHYVNNTIQFLNTLTIFSSRGVTIDPIKDSIYDFSHPEDNRLNEWNVSLHIRAKDPANVSVIADEYFGWIVLESGWCYFFNHYPSSLSHDDKLCLHFTLYAIIKHFWFTAFVADEMGVPGSADASFSPFSTLFVFLLVLVIVLRSRRTQLKKFKDKSSLPP